MARGKIIASALRKAELKKLRKEIERTEKLIFKTDPSLDDALDDISKVSEVRDYQKDLGVLLRKYGVLEKKK